MPCPWCKGHDHRVIAPGYLECTSVVVVNGPVNTPAGTAIVPQGYVCGYRYQAGGSGTTQVCTCGTFAIGLCHDCGVPVCGDCSSIAGGQRICSPCAQARQDRAAARQLSVTDAAIAAITAIADPVERFLRITYLHETCELPGDAWDRAQSPYPPWQPDSAAVGGWFAAKATAHGVAPDARLDTYIKRPARWGKAKFEPGDPIRCWSLWNRPKDTGAPPRYVLPDGSVVLHQVPCTYEHKSGNTRVVTGEDQQIPVDLDRPALLKIIELLGLADDRHGLKRRRTG